MNNNKRLANYTKGKKSPVKADGTLNVTPAQGSRLKQKAGAKVGRAQKPLSK